MTEKRKNYFQRLRDRLQSAITRQQEDTGPWESPDRYMIRGVPDVLFYSVEIILLA